MTRLIKFEFYKLFCKRSILIVLMLFSVINFFKIQNEFDSYSYLANGNDARSWNSVYWQLYDDYSGTITSEKIDKLISVYQPLAEATDDMTASTATDNPNTMTGNVYSDRNLLEKYYVQPMEYFYNYENSASKVAQLAKENVEIYNTHGQSYEARKNAVIYNLYANRSISTFAYREMYNYYVNYDFSTVLILLICLYGIVGTFVSEKETQMDMLLLTNKHGGRKTTLAKIIAASLFVLGVSLWFSIVDYVGFAASFGTVEGYNLPIYAISNFSTASVNWNLLQYSIFSSVTRAIGIWTMNMVFLLVSMFWKNALVPFVTNFGLCLCFIISGASLSHSSNVWLKVINPYSLLTNRTLFGKTEFINIADYPILSYAAAILLALMTGMIIVTVIMFLSSKNYHCRERRKKCQDLLTN